MTTTRIPKHLDTRLRRLHGLMADAERHVTGYRAMLDIARRHDMPFEVERLEQALGEFEGALVELMEMAIREGYGPEDFDDIGIRR
jgi:hypothetical protein